MAEILLSVESCDATRSAILDPQSCIVLIVPRWQPANTDVFPAVLILCRNMLKPNVIGHRKTKGLKSSISFLGSFSQTLLFDGGQQKPEIRMHSRVITIGVLICFIINICFQEGKVLWEHLVKKERRE